MYRKKPRTAREELERELDYRISERKLWFKREKTRIKLTLQFITVVFFLHTVPIAALIAFGPYAAIIMNAVTGVLFIFILWSFYLAWINLRWRKYTQFDRERKTVFLHYAGVMLVCLYLPVITGSLVGWRVGVMVFIGLFPIMIGYTIVFAFVWTHMDQWGWLMGGRRRIPYGTRQQTRSRRDLSFGEAEQIARESAEFDELTYHTKADGLKDLREAEKRIKRMREHQKPVYAPELKKSYGKGVMLCPSCETPFVFDADNKTCSGCGTVLHDGTKMVVRPKKAE